MPKHQLNLNVRSVAYSLPVAILALACAGCAPPSIHGKWTSNGVMGVGAASYEFKPDGGFSSVVRYDGGETMLPMDVTLTGTYTIKNQLLTTKISKVEIGTMGEEFLESLPRQARNRIKKPLKAYIQFTSPDQINLVEESSTALIRLTRVKESQ